jgi:hypothetical protein
MKVEEPSSETKNLACIVANPEVTHLSVQSAYRTSDPSILMMYLGDCPGPLRIQTDPLPFSAPFCFSFLFALSASPGLT